MKKTGLYPIGKSFFKKQCANKGWKLFCSGLRPLLCFEEEGIVDLRGKTNLFEMLSIIKNRCRYLLVPDSGVLSITYYIDAHFPIDVVSLWADPRQGILKQNVSSPNPFLRHVPLIAKNKDLRTVEIGAAMSSLFSGGKR